ncbi:uncharacterized protein [Linepithema humile]|uniref:uncharacterized protein n=1 Tax=Linepithema humile TaxID=83485 RepID=UPI000623A1FA|nr:PREDICTED: uncharacterized protein LOC105677311 [Linepithema humile]
MAKSVNRILLFTFALSFARKGEQADFTQEHERRWNTPPELTPESVVKISNDEKFQTRLLSLSPVTATFSLNAGDNNAHSVSLGASLDGVSLSESNNYNHPTGHGIDGSSVSVSKSTTLSAGLSGISTAGAEAYNKGNNAKTESHSLSFGQASATSFGAIENGQAITGASSSVGASQSSAIANDNRGQSFSQASAISTQYQNRPTWSNVGPSNEYNDRRFGRPTLTISKPYDGRRPTLNIGIADIHRREQRPTIHIYKWRPNHRVLPRPNLSIEHRQHNSWNSQTHGSIGPQFEISSNSGPYAFSAGDSISQAQSFSSVSGHRNGNAQVNAQAVGNGHAHGIASSEGGSFARFPENSQTIPLHYVRSKSSKQYDSDVFSDLAQTVGELLDIA